MSKVHQNQKTETETFRRVYGSKRRVKVIKAQPCWWCSNVPSENAHCPPKHDSSGIARKADWIWIVPLCFGCHRKRDTFYGSNGAVLDATGRNITEAAKYYAARFDQDGNDLERDMTF